MELDALFLGSVVNDLPAFFGVAFLISIYWYAFILELLDNLCFSI